jgi:hypothetical protein
MMNDHNDDDFLLDLPPGTIVEKIPHKKRNKREEDFVMISLTLLKRLKGAQGSAVTLALILLYQGWRAHGDSIRLTNAGLEEFGFDKDRKSRALADLEERGLIAVERSPRKSPTVRLVGDGWQTGRRPRSRPS